MEQRTPTTTVQDITPIRLQAQLEQSEDEIDLLELFFALVSHWRSLLLACLIGAAIMGAYHTWLVEPTYKASTEMYITSTDSVISLQDLQIGNQLASDYTSIITSRAVLNKVIEDLDLDTTYKDLRGLVSVSNIKDTHIIRTSVSTSDLALSRDIANDLLVVSIDRIYQIVGTNMPSVIEYSEAEAVEDETPSILRYMAIGGLAGILLVAAFVVIKNLMDNSVRTDDDVEKYLQLPVLAAVPYFKE